MINFKNYIELKTYLKDPFEFATEHLLGAYLCSEIGGEFTSGKITELEVYLGNCDKACHAYPNKITPRNQVMFAQGGCSYVFFVYGMYSQFNVVIGPQGEGNAILIRSLEPISGLDVMMHRRKTDKLNNLTTGPGKLCQALGINFKEHNGLILNKSPLWLSQNNFVPEYISSKRIGIDYAEEYKDKLWRFYIKDNPYISKK